ncbi:MAG: hypothetical protein ACRDHZ_01490 [Ktedonobacteraceae bacterium]
MTVLDEFVVKLKIDPKGFNEGEREAFEKLRRLEKQSEAFSAHIDESMRKGMFAFYQEFNKAVGGSQTSLTQTGEQSRRTGEKIAVAGTTGAAGFKQLTGSLLEAYAAIDLVEGAFHKLEQASDRATSTALTSLTTGIPPRQLSALAGMFPLVPQGQAFSVFEQIKSWAGLWQAGEFPQSVMTALTRYASLAGTSVNTAQLGSVRGMLQEISTIVRGLPVNMRLPFLSHLGMGKEWLPELLKSPAALQRDYAAAMRRAPITQVTTELFNLKQQAKKTEQSFSTFWETVEASAAKHGGIAALQGLDTGLQKTNNWLTTTKQGADALKDAL